jgi:hypothetical protein
MTKTSLVTGGARGIGRACALALADSGFDIALVNLLEKEMAATARNIRNGLGEICHLEDGGYGAGFDLRPTSTDVQQGKCRGERRGQHHRLPTAKDRHLRPSSSLSRLRSSGIRTSHRQTISKLPSWQRRARSRSANCRYNGVV